MTVLMVAPLDDEHLQFVIQLQLQEIEEANQAIIGKGKQSEGSQTDRQAALNHFMGELQSANNFAADSRMARSLQNAILHDGDALVQSQKEELAAQEDYAMATDLNEGRIGSLPTAADTGTPADDLEFLEKLSCIYITGTEGIDSDADTAHDLNEQDMGLQAESSSWAASRAPQNKPKRRCVACGDQKHFAEMAKAPCEHEYCRACLEHLFRDAMIDESFFPPRCCKQPIPLDKNQIFLVAEVARQFREKALEFSTPNRTYCHDPKCAAFIPPTNYDKAEAIATCDTCEGRTCMNCKKAQHGGDCPDDEELSQVLQLAREQGWQRCQNCWRLVELNTGCNHMTWVFQPHHCEVLIIVPQAADIFPVVLADSTSVINADCDGKPASAPSGMRPDYMSGLSRSTSATSQPNDPPRRATFPRRETLWWSSKHLPSKRCKRTPKKDGFKHWYRT